jgi:hypothetical protein
MLQEGERLKMDLHAIAGELKGDLLSTVGVTEEGVPRARGGEGRWCPKKAGYDVEVVSHPSLAGPKLCSADLVIVDYTAWTSRIACERHGHLEIDGATDERRDRRHRSLAWKPPAA